MSPSLLFLTGEYEHKLDSKNRLFIPGRLRECIYPERDGLGFFLVFGPNKILGLYPDEYYRRLALREMQVRSDGLEHLIEKGVYCRHG